MGTKLNILETVNLRILVEFSGLVIQLFCHSCHISVSVHELMTQTESVKKVMAASLLTLVFHSNKLWCNQQGSSWYSHLKIVGLFFFWVHTTMHTFWLDLSLSLDKVPVLISCYLGLYIIPSHRKNVPWKILTLVFYFTAFQYLGYTVWSGRMTNWEGFGNGCGLIQVLSQHLPGGATKIWTKHLPNTSLDHYHYTNLLNETLSKLNTVLTQILVPFLQNFYIK
jgi:hypothetical protein